MKRCPNENCADVRLFGVVGEYSDTVDACQRCGTRLELVLDSATEKPTGGEEVPGFAMAGRISNAAVIPVAKSLLDSAGIRYVTRNEHTQDLFGSGRLGTNFNPIVGPVEFWVEAEALLEAREVLDGLQK